MRTTSFISGEERLAKPPRQQPRNEELRDTVVQALGLGARRDTIRLASGEEAEAVYEDEDGLVCVHAVPRPVSLALAGLVVFFGAVLAARHDGRTRSIGITRSPDAIVAGLLRRYPGCDVVGLTVSGGRAFSSSRRAHGAAVATAVGQLGAYGIGNEAQPNCFAVRLVPVAARFVGLSPASGERLRRLALEVTRRTAPPGYWNASRCRDGGPWDLFPRAATLR